MMTLDDTTLIAYIDGELDPLCCAEVEAELARDPALTNKVSALRESTALIGTAFNHALYGPLPTLNSSSHSASVVSLHPSSSHQQNKSTSWLPLALAASLAILLVGGLGGHYLGDFGLHSVEVATSNSDVLLRQETLRRSLDKELSGTAVVWRNPDSSQAGSVTPIRTFRAKTGQYCREFEEHYSSHNGPRSEGGIACRGDDGIWQVRMRFYPE